MKERSDNCLKVQNDLKDLNEGIDYEFTIRDKNILDDGDDGNLEILENSILNKINKKSSDTFDNKINYSFAKNESKFSLQNQDGFLIPKPDMPEEVDKTNEVNKIKEKMRLLKDRTTRTQNNNHIILGSAVEKPKEQHLNFDKQFTNDYMSKEEYKTKIKEFKKIKSVPLKRRILSINQEEDTIQNINESSENSVVNRKVYDEYNELNNYLEKQRFLVNKAVKIQPEEKIKEILDQSNNIIVKSEENTTPDKKLEEHPEFMITEISEFLKKVPSKKEIEENYKFITSSTPLTLREVKSGTQSIVNVPLPSERLKYGIKSNNDTPKNFLNQKRERLELDGVKTESSDTTQSKIDPNSTEEKVEVLEEPLVGKGIGVALQVLRKRGLIGKKQTWGRNKDSLYTTNDYFLKEEKSKKPKPYNFELQYRDMSGKNLTPKEMFRRQCYIFHGEGPSKRKMKRGWKRNNLKKKTNY